GEAGFILASPDRGADPPYDGCLADASESCVVQWGQRTAFTGIFIAQVGHSFEVGSASGAPLSLLIARTSRKTAPATMRKLIASVRKLDRKSTRLNSSH